MAADIIVKIIEIQQRIKKSVQLMIGGCVIASALGLFFTPYVKSSIAGIVTFGIVSHTIRLLNDVLDNTTSCAIFTEDEDSLRQNALRVTEDQSQLKDCVTGKPIEHGSMYCKCLNNHAMTYDTKNMLRKRRLEHLGLTEDKLIKLMVENDTRVTAGKDERNIFFCIKIDDDKLKKIDASLDKSIFYDMSDVTRSVDCSWWYDSKLTYDVRCPECDTMLSKALVVEFAQ
jgi:hypothetical protein